MMSELNLSHEKLLSKFLNLAVGVRFPNDSFFNNGNRLIPHLKKFGIFETDLEDLLHEPVPLFRCDLGCSKTFDTVYDFEQHYDSCHRYSCDTCRKSLISPHLLDLHVSEAHDSYFAVQSERYPMFRCYLEDCSAIFQTPQLRKAHCIDNHNFPTNFCIDKSIVLPRKVDNSQLKMDVERNPQVKKKCKNTAKTKQTDNSQAASDKMDIVDNQPKKIAPKKSLGAGNRHGRRQNFFSFERDMLASLPTVGNISDIPESETTS